MNVLNLPIKNTQFSSPLFLQNLTHENGFKQVSKPRTHYIWFIVKKEAAPNSQKQITLVA